MESAASASERNRNGGIGAMQSLFGEFKTVYEDRLRNLDEADRTGEDTSRVCVQ